MATAVQGMPIASAEDRATRNWKFAYWVSTALFVTQLAASGILLVVRPPGVIELVHHLGYPDYFPPLLGVAKMLGVIGLLQPWLATLREWTYAGVTFDLIAASFSHAASHDATKGVALPLIVLGLLAASYSAHRRMERRAVSVG